MARVEGKRRVQFPNRDCIISAIVSSPRHFTNCIIRGNYMGQNLELQRMATDRRTVLSWLRNSQLQLYIHVETSVPMDDEKAAEEEWKKTRAEMNQKKQFLWGWINTCKSISRAPWGAENNLQQWLYTWLIISVIDVRWLPGHAQARPPISHVARLLHTAPSAFNLWHTVLFVCKTSDNKYARQQDHPLTSSRPILRSTSLLKSYNPPWAEKEKEVSSRLHYFLVFVYLNL